MSFTVGENVGAYRVVAQLGQGGMATVFKAYHPGLDRYVAIKVMHAAFKQDETFIQRFSREARIVARLDHPNIIPVYDYAEHRGHMYLVMRYVEGETLKARLKRGPLSKEQIIEVAERVGAALGYAHEQGILHRDIKPSNVLLTSDAADSDSLKGVFLTDFGLARIAEAGESTLSRDMMMGTPQYISPEQAKGVRDLDAGTDIYSLGVLMFEMVTGQVPFSADTPYSVIHDHIFTPLPLPTSIKPEISDNVERVLLRALAKEREDRFPDVASFITALTRALRQELPTQLSADLAQAGLPAGAGKTAVATASASSPPSIDDLGSQPAIVEESKTLPDEAARKRKRTWLFIGGALVLLCLCSMVLLGPVRQAIQENATATAEAVIPEEAPLPDDEQGLPEELPLQDEKADLPDRIAKTEERVAENPKDAIAHLDLAWLYLEAGRVEEGEGQMREAVELRPEEEWLYMDIGRHLLETQRPELAAETFVIGLEVLPDSKPLHFALAELYFMGSFIEENPGQAEEFARKLVERFPDDPLFHTLLAHALIRNGEMDKARGELDMLVQEHPDMAEVHLINGLWFRKNGQRIQARREYRLALELAGDREWLRTVIERELEGMGDE